MAEFNKDDYLNDLPDADDFADKTAASAPAGSAPADGTAPSMTASPRSCLQIFLLLFSATICAGSF